MHKQEILEICYTINDLSVKHELIGSILNNKWNQARLISEWLVDKNPNNNTMKRLDDLITDNFFN